MLVLAVSMAEELAFVDDRIFVAGARHFAAIARAIFLASPLEPLGTRSQTLVWWTMVLS